MTAGKKEKEKEKKTTSVSDRLVVITLGLSEAISARAQIMQSAIAQQALQSARVSEAFQRMAGSLHTMEAFNNMIKQQQLAMQTLQRSSIGLKTIMDYQSGVTELANRLVGINKMIESVKISIPVLPKLTTELAAIPSRNDTLVKSLLREIEFLEKELAKEKGTNKQLIALLEEKRKDLTKQYVT